jgi:flagellar motor switch protein FliN/FliY
MPLNDQEQQSFIEFLQKVSSEYATNMAQTLNAEFDLSVKNFSKTQIEAGQVQNVENKSLLVNASATEKELGSLAYVLEEDLAENLAAAASGADKKALDEESADAVKEVISQVTTSTLHMLLSKNQNATLMFDDFEAKVIDTNDEETLKFKDESNYFTILAELSIGDNFKSEAYLNISENLIKQILEDFKDISLDLSSGAKVNDVDFANMKSQPTEDVNEQRNLNLLMDIRMGLIVELGRAEMQLRDILKLTKGSVIELDRLSGEPVDLFVNNKIIARGEVVVIDDSFGLRITQLAGSMDIGSELGLTVGV